MRALYSAAQGMKAQQFNIDTISNNMSNVNTIGYKKMRTEFKDLLYEQIKRPFNDKEKLRPTSLELGNGVSIGATLRTFTTGSFKVTELPYDLAIDGDGFFKIKDDNGRILYTRDGSFKLSSGEDSLKIVTKDGYFLQGRDGDIELGTEVKNTYISDSGEVVVERKTGEKEVVGDIDISYFTNPSGLKALGGNYYEETSASGEVIEDEEVQTSMIKQGTLEFSNISVVEEMVNLITAQRAYEINSKVIQTADQMIDLANNLKR